MRAWSETEAGQVIVLQEDLRLGTAPPKADIERVASEILALGKQKISPAGLGSSMTTYTPVVKS